MKNKFTTLMFGLLTAVGWTVGAQAQMLPEANSAPWTKVTTPTLSQTTHQMMTADPAKVEKRLHNVGSQAPQHQAKSNRMYAPLRTPNTITADVTYPKNWYETDKSYTWYPSFDSNAQPQTAQYTQVVTDPYQMYYMVKSIYTDPVIPGIQYDEVYQKSTEYPVIANGWNMVSNAYGDVTIRLSNSYGRIAGIFIDDISDEANELVEWVADEDLPEGWTSSTTLNKTTYNDGTNNYACVSMNNGGTITIPGSLLTNSSGGIKVYVYAATTYSTTLTVGSASANISSTWTPYSLAIDPAGGMVPPDENGYTVMMVKVKNDATDFPVTTGTAQGLIDSCFSKFESIELLTDGLRVGEGTENAGTVFSYTGTMNRFFFIGKGKTAQFTSYAPFYNMYEEFSPTPVDEGAETKDFYIDMVAGETYGVQHDCESVSFREHYFSMSGKQGTESRSLSSLVLYIPDDRSTPPSDGYVYRQYDHEPEVGLYLIDLSATAAPDQTQDKVYQVTLDWSSSLDAIVENHVKQTFEIYKVEFDTLGNRTFIPVDTVKDVSTYTYPEKQDTIARQLVYVIKGYPTEATNPDYFFIWSNIDDVVIPGLFDFMLLERDHYESDFDYEKVKNFYRNYIYPTNLAPNTGMTVSQVKDWPNKTAKYTLYRNDYKTKKPVADLEVRVVGEKVYYRITYYDENQDYTGPNDIEIPYNNNHNTNN